MKKKIDIGGVDPILFVGLNDENIKLLENHFNSKIIVRGSDMNVDGSKDEVSHIELVVRNMLTLINKQGSLTIDDVSDLLSFNNLNNKEISIDNDPIVLHSHKGPVFAKTKGQKLYLDAVLKSDIVFAVGPAGTGKTYQAVASAVSSLKNKEVEKIVVTRPAVEAGERLGFLPGDLKEKIDPYLRPIYDSFDENLPKDKVTKLIENQKIEIAPIAYLRGRTLNNSYIILDEAQNTSPIQMKMFLTRFGEQSKMVITGDITQTDLPSKSKSGLKDAINNLKKIKDISFVYLSDKDVVRHSLVQKIVKAYNK
ncbi:MAG: phosphate starvation-inducible protein PhoH [Pelagibacteraceae bacterium]|nr:phosphate starvation-inducible protein PhoH [Pelagibacteraceae bacterium]